MVFILDATKKHVQKVKQRVWDTNLDNLVWIVNIVPNAAGFSVRRDYIQAPFFIIHLFLLLYVYAAGCAVYQIKFAIGAGDFIKSYVNVSLLILIGNITRWWIKKRPILRAVLKGIEESDRLVSSADVLRAQHTRYLRIIKTIIIAFYASQLLDAAFIYLPHRVDVNHDYSMVPCPGLEPVTSTPYKEICLTILFAQELSIMVVVLNYQAMLLLLIAHTAMIFHMLSFEMMALNFTNLKEHQAYVKGKLPLLIKRHALTLQVFHNLKLLYSVPLGVDFASNAVCISLFFYIPIQEWLKFIPVLVYCFLVFFLYCFLGQKLTNASEVFERAVYSCGWENFDIKEQKLIYVMLRQAQKPVILLAADIIPVNIYTFATTLQGMFKFVTVVKV